MKIIKLLALFIAISLSVTAQKKKTENTLLWEISGKGLAKPSYIFGTYHFIGRDFVDTMKVLNAKLDQADAVVGELVMDTKEMMKLAPYMMLKDTSLDKVLSTDEFAKVNEIMMAKARTDLKAFNVFNPMAVQVMLLPHFAPISFSQKNLAIDFYFQNVAKEKNKPVLGLETVEEQAKILFGTPLEKQKENLLKFVNDTAKAKKQGLDLYNAYVKQDIAAMTQAFETNDDFTEAEMNVLLKDRNAKWIEKLPEMMENKSLFIAVGAGHLVGKDGLIKGLRAKGYTLTPVVTN